MIVFDLLCSQPHNGTKFHGWAEYTKTVFREYLLRTDKKEAGGVVALFNTEAFMDDWMLSIIKEYSVIVRNVRNKRDIEDTLKELSKTYEIIFYSGMMYDYEDVVFPEKVYRIGTFHGLRLIEKPFDDNILKYSNDKGDLKAYYYNLFFGKYLYKRNYESYLGSMRNFDCIITVSEYSKYSIMVHFPEIAREKQIFRLYPPLKYSSVTGKKKDDAEKYIMMISGGRWLKNSLRGMKAIDTLYSKGFLIDTKTKIFGGYPRRGIKELKNINMFEFHDYVTDQELEDAYCNSSMLFYPTLNEGFGSPPLEVMKYGKTVVLSSVCSLTEIYGAAVYYCNPYDDIEMQNKILQAANKPIDEQIIKRRVDSIAKMQMNDMDSLIRLLEGK